MLSNGRDKITTGQKVFRFLVPLEKAETNPLVKNFLDTAGLNRTSAIGSAHRRLVVYPCRSGTLLNCAFLHPATEADDLAGRGSSWLNPGTVEDLVRQLDGFDDGVREFCKMAEDLKLFSLVTRDPPPTYVKGKLALMGDAAHPMLPRKAPPISSSSRYSTRVLIPGQIKDRVAHRLSRTLPRSGPCLRLIRRRNKSTSCWPYITKSVINTR